MRTERMARRDKVSRTSRKHQHTREPLDKPEKRMVTIIFKKDKE